MSWVRRRRSSYYRVRLETYLNAKFDDAEWQAMIDLGFLVDDPVRHLLCRVLVQTFRYA